MSVTRDVTRDVHRDVTPEMAVTFAVSHTYPSRPVPTRPICRWFFDLVGVQPLPLQRLVTRWSGLETARAGR